MQKKGKMKGIVSSVIIALLFLGLFGFAFTLQTARAQSGTIYIMPDGSITPFTANITSLDNVTYTFTGNNYLPIVVQRSNIIIDGRGYKVQAPGYYTIGFSLSDVSNVTIKNTAVINGGSAYTIGFSLEGVSNVTIKNTAVTYSGYGIVLGSSSGNVLSGNNVTANVFGGIWLNYSSRNVLSGNNVSVDYQGITLDYSSDNNTLSDNIAIANAIYGIWLNYGSDNNILSSNTIYHGGNGIELNSSSGNVLSGNNDVANDLWGIWLSYSSGNMIFHNDFNINIQQNHVSGGSTDVWDDGYPSGGNYWSNYTGIDQKSGPYQNLTGSDGIGDTPYIIGSNNTDRYPLMAPFSTFNVGTWNNTPYNVSIVTNSTISNFSFDQAAKTLTFNVTGTSGTVGFCRIAIPLSLMSCIDLADWTVTINGSPPSPLSFSITVNGNYTYIYLTYHYSTDEVQITSTSDVPEFQPLFFLPLFMIATLLAALVLKRKRNVGTQ